VATFPPFAGLAWDIDASETSGSLFVLVFEGTFVSACRWPDFTDLVSAASLAERPAAFRPFAEVIGAAGFLFSLLTTLFSAGFEIRFADAALAFRLFFCGAGRCAGLAATFFLAGALTAALSLALCFRSLAEDEPDFVRRRVDRAEDVFSDLLLLVLSDFFFDFLRAAI
jgi:hypothetical protein